MKKLKIVYEDKYFIVVDKPANQLTISTAKNESNTLYKEVSAYVKKKYPKNKIFIVHRLDKQTSGLIIFAKTPQIQKMLQNSWNNVYREYVAITEGIPSHQKEQLKNYLVEDKNLYTYCTNNQRGAQLAITNYEIIKSNLKNAMLKINILTGKKNQIRVQLANIGCPIIGDKKYGAKSNQMHRLGLHANKLIFFHPITKEKLNLEAKLPIEFTKIIK